MVVVGVRGPDYGSYPAKCSEGRALSRTWRPATKDWLPTHADDGTTCDHALDDSDVGTAATLALLASLGLG